HLLLSFLAATPSTLSSFFFHSYGPHPDLHSFPTRRSSDLTVETRPGSARRGDISCLGVGAPDGGTQAPRPRRDGVPRRLGRGRRSEEHTSELQSPCNLVCRLLLEKKKKKKK